MALNIFGLNCTLKPSRKASSTDRLMKQAMDEFKKYDAIGEIVRAADYNIKPGVSSDEGRGDEWPRLLKKIIACDILFIGTPIWLGQPSSMCKRVLERMDAFIDEKDDKNRMPSYGKVAVVAVVGNEDGAHHVHAECYQALNEVGFTLPAHSGTYWVGEAMGEKEYKDFKRPPKSTAFATRLMVSNTVHLAEFLSRQNYPGIDK